MKTLISFIIAVTLMGCGTSVPPQDVKKEQLYLFELTQSQRIYEIKSFNVKDKAYNTTYSYIAPIQYEYPALDTTAISSMWKVIDIRDSMIFLSRGLTSIKSYNRVDNPLEYRKIMEAAMDYYAQRRD